MKRLPVLLLAIFLGIFLPACQPEEVPSYVGKWLYSGSEPDLGDDYDGSYVIVDRLWEYSFYDAPSGQTFSGTGRDFVHEGLQITLTASNDYETRIYVVQLQFLKEDRMVVQTASVNGTPTEIRFTRDPHSF
ncbi:MAG: hypothetical protein K5910_05895 [Bacteroidales bacterium]|nr:hypothetical protein [Bacteroidales bacterium]